MVESSLRSFSVPSRAPGIGEKNLEIRLDRETQRESVECSTRALGPDESVRYWAGDGALSVWTLPFSGWLVVCRQAADCRGTVVRRPTKK